MTGLMVIGTETTNTQRVERGGFKAGSNTERPATPRAAARARELVSRAARVRRMLPLRVYGVAIASMLAGAGVVHNVFQPDLTIPGYEPQDKLAQETQK